MHICTFIYIICVNHLAKNAKNAKDSYDKHLNRVLPY